jgi:nicotinate-nucleotide pyrophosphorylase (carboxylating)
MDRRAIREFTHRAGDYLKVSNENYKQWIFRYTFLELEKDLGLFGDISTKAVFSGPKAVRARIVAKESGVLAGVQEIEYFLRSADRAFRPRVTGEFKLDFMVRDGESFSVGDVVVEIEADVHDLLAVERTVLNLLSRMSGVATFTRKLVESVEGEDVMLAATRKTLWGLLDKRAVFLGGGGTHRLNLSDSVILKDTHLDLWGRDLDLLFEKLVSSCPETRFVEVEVENGEEALVVAQKFQEAVEEKKLMVVGVIMLDNMSAEAASEVVGHLKAAGLYDAALLEASGGICEENLEEYAKTGVDILSMSQLTGGVKGVDFSLKVV